MLRACSLALVLAGCTAVPATPSAPEAPLQAAHTVAPASPAASPAPPPAPSAPQLQRHTVTADDGHPLAVHARRPAQPRAAIVLVHGRTWSGLPDFDLQVPGEDVSLMAALADRGIAAYAVDLRGYGATDRDATGFATPSRSAADVAAVLRFVAADAGVGKPHLLGWSLGSLVTVLTATTTPELVAGVVLYGHPCSASAGKSPRAADPQTPKRAANTAEAAAADFTPGAASPAVVSGFVAAALRADPVRADWRSTAEWDNLRLADLRAPVLAIHGELDLVTDHRCMAGRFTELRGIDRRWEILAGGDHAAHLERTAPAFVAAVAGFVLEH